MTFYRIVHFQTSHNILQTMVELAPSVIFPRVVTHCTVILAKSAFVTVTTEEVAIMNTPEGEIYNKSVLERLVVSLVKEMLK